MKRGRRGKCLQDEVKKNLIHLGSETAQREMILIWMIIPFFFPLSMISSREMPGAWGREGGGGVLLYELLEKYL